MEFRNATNHPYCTHYDDRVVRWDLVHVNACLWSIVEEIMEPDGVDQAFAIFARDYASVVVWHRARIDKGVILQAQQHRDNPAFSILRFTILDVESFEDLDRRMHALFFDRD